MFMVTVIFAMMALTFRQLQGYCQCGQWHLVFRSQMCVCVRRLCHIRGFI